MSNIRTANKRHKRALAQQVSKKQAAKAAVGAAKPAKTAIKS